MIITQVYKNFYQVPALKMLHMVHLCVKLLIQDFHLQIKDFTSPLPYKTYIKYLKLNLYRKI